MELPINNKDLDTIVKALSLGGDARLYHLLKNVREEIMVEDQLQSMNESHGTCDI
tara:strand:- start:687 stop:851 length:165 start_codon:yes stop_codon:yes gene_type:complete